MLKKSHFRFSSSFFGNFKRPLKQKALVWNSNAKSLAAGFTYTPFTKTVDDCLAWYKKQGDPDIVFGQGGDAVGLERSKEMEVIKTLKELKS